MAKPLKSQWEFGELFPAEQVRKVLTVSEVNGSIRRVIEKEIGSIWVTGEITNLKLQPSGHVYFSIKDASSQLACVLFRKDAANADREYLRDGQKVILQGELTMYEARGQCQLRVLSVQLQGLGALQAAFERLKVKLQSEGLFDNGHKRPLPAFPRSIGLVTSRFGAAIRDVLHGIERRNPALRIILCSCRVQGAGAAQEIAAAIHTLNDWALETPRSKLDLILVTRGGGSLEDLWAFNEEIVVRAIYASRLPVISAVGHEIDFTISDFVADFRAATPTAAAEIITEGIFSRRERLNAIPTILIRALLKRLDQKKQLLTGSQRSLLRAHPRRRLMQQMQRLDEMQNSIHRCLRHDLQQKQTLLQVTAARLNRMKPQGILIQRQEQLRNLIERMRAASDLGTLSHKLSALETRLRLLSPLHVLDRGYSITYEAESGKVLSDAAEILAGKEIISRLKSGQLRSVVKSRGSDSPI